MAQLCLVLDVPGWSGEQLKQAVVDVDFLDSNGEPIAMEHVGVDDIITIMFNAELGATYRILYQGIQEDDDPGRQCLGEVVPPHGS